MSQKLWFGKPRRMTLRSCAVLVGKAPTKQKRIKMLCTHNVSSEPTGLPEWTAASEPVPHDCYAFSI